MELLPVKTRQLNTQRSLRYDMAGHQELRFGHDLGASPIDDSTLTGFGDPDLPF